MPEKKKKLRGSRRATVAAPTYAGDRTVQFKFTLSPEERRMLDEVAAERGLTPSDFLRQCVRGRGEPR